MARDWSKGNWRQVWGSVLNSNTTAWYPKDNFTNYAYVDSLKGYISNPNANTAYNGAHAALDAAHSSLSASEIDQAFSLLNNLWQSERQKEKDFIKTNLKVDIDFSTGNEIKQLVEGINFFQNNSVFKSTVDFISKIEWDSETGRWASEKGQNEEFYALFKWIIPDNIAQTIKNFNFAPYLNNPEQGAEILSNLIGQNIRNIFEEKRIALSKKSELNSEEQEFQQLMDVILDASAKNHFIADVLTAYSVNIPKILTAFKKLSKASESPVDGLNPDDFIKRPVGNGMAGNAYEAFTDRILEGLAGAWNSSNGDIKITTMATGSLNFMKPDELLFFAQGEVNTGALEKAFKDRVKEIAKDDRSVRAQNMEGMKVLKQQLENVTIVEISEKNYNLLGSSFDDRAKKNGAGFTAQQNVSLDVLNGVLSRSNLPSATIGDLIFILVNSGSGMMNGDYSDAIHVVEAAIANMLFDDAQLSDEFDDNQSSVTTIHVFNLDGIYMPLSVLLEGIYNASQNAYKNMNDWLDVRFVAKRGTPNTEDSDNGKDLTKDDWNSFYQFKRSNNVLNIHFFGDFINWVKQNL